MKLDFTWYNPFKWHDAAKNISHVRVLFWICAIRDLCSFYWVIEEGMLLEDFSVWMNVLKTNQELHVSVYLCVSLHLFSSLPLSLFTTPSLFSFSFSHLVNPSRTVLCSILHLCFPVSFLFLISLCAMQPFRRSVRGTRSEKERWNPPALRMKRCQWRRFWKQKWPWSRRLSCMRMAAQVEAL